MISQISNGLNVISNVKGFSERGAVGFCNAALFGFVVNVYGNKKTEDRFVLEDEIQKINFDEMLAEYCRLYLKLQEKKSSANAEPVSVETVKNDTNVSISRMLSRKLS